MNTPIRWRPALGAFALAAGALWGASASATLASCNAVGDPASLGWQNEVRPVNQRGQRLATRLMTINVSFVASGMTGQTTHRFGLAGSYSGGRPLRDGVVTLSRPQGTGLRVTYVGRSQGDNGAFWSGESNQVFRNTSPLIENFGIASSNGRYTLSLRYLYEVVITDPALYTAGGAPLRAESPITVGLTTGDCAGLSYSIFAFEQAPNLPAAVQPGCTWDMSSLTQAVALSPVEVDAVAQYGSARTAGDQGQAEFALRASACTTNTPLRVFFTDISDPQNRSNVLGLSAAHARREEVGLRLYSGSSNTPLGFGPPPTATTDHSHALRFNTGTTGSLSLPFTAQYVLRQGVAPDSLRGGQIQAQATVTIDYQ